MERALARSERALVVLRVSGPGSCQQLSVYLQGSAGHGTETVGAEPEPCQPQLPTQTELRNCWIQHFEEYLAKSNPNDEGRGQASTSLAKPV